MSFSYPFFWWILPFVLLISVAIAVWLYAKNPLQISSKLLSILLITIRALCLFFLFLLLLGPLFKWKQTTFLKPLLLLAIDNSESMLLHSDALEIKQNLASQIDKIKQELENDFSVETVLFSDQVKPQDSLNFKGKLTGFDALFEDAKLRFANRNEGAMLVISDGNYNTGTEPSYLANDFRFPVYTLGTGDTSSFKDCWLHHPKYNELVYAENAFTIAFNAQAKGFPIANSQVQLFENGKCLATKPVQLKNGQVQNCFFEILAQKEGVHTYQIKLQAVSGEKTIANNQLQVVVEVLKSKQKIVLVYAVPHPDIAAIKQLLQSNKNIDLETVSLQEHQASSIQKSDVYILYQIPGQKSEALKLVEQLNSAQMPQFYILGAQTNLAALNQLKMGFEIYGNRNNTSDAKAWNVKTENLFISDADFSVLEKLPPLTVPYGTYQLAPFAEVILGQQIGYVKTDLPLLFFLKNHSQKKAVLCGEGLWHWKLLAFQQNKNNEFLMGLLSKTIQYIAGKEDKSRFRVKPLKKLFDENEEIQFEAAYFNELFEPSNAERVLLSITIEQNKEFKFEFEKNDQAYQLNAGLLTPGIYTYKAEVEGISGLKKQGSFQIKQVLAEQSVSGANHTTLRKLAAESNGMFFPYQQIADFPALLKKQYPSKQVIVETDIVQELISFKFLLFALFLLASVEWFVRKWNGFI